jgi:protein associated with RNAse G/E
MTTHTWQLSALKYDQHIHYTFPMIPVSDDGSILRFRSEPGSILIHYTRGLKIPQRRCDLTFWRDHWFNVYTNYDEQDAFSYLYCNVGLPPVLESNTLSFVDLDLDVRFFPGGSYEVLDEDEFIDHAMQYQYPESVQERARRTIDELIALASEKNPPFDILYR